MHRLHFTVGWFRFSTIYLFVTSSTPAKVYILWLTKPELGDLEQEWGLNPPLTE